ncbi:hypothetical protein AXG93_1913s1440 [Marchantia polymorpha subsp. ruderalis]|uniref:Uncharacterized protein n=1 Tax=Marchantia polymorpha subsp. ruderalis TaxID=1480154 RepID=A0A176WL58_MARPO|nr:hypothetical protein AXG93_1913s1440 [Marchantia polymorpha subsp. ruderalis]
MALVSCSSPSESLPSGFGAAAATYYERDSDCACRSLAGSRHQTYRANWRNVTGREGKGRRTKIAGERVLPTPSG